MTTLFLKWSNTANFIRVERRGGSERWEERLICICIWSGKCKWTKWSDKRKMWIPLCSYLQIEKKWNTHFFSIGQALLHSYKMPLYQTFNKPPWFHLWIPDDVLRLFRAAISLFLFEIFLVFCCRRTSVSCWLKACGLWNLQFKDTFFRESRETQQAQSASSFIIVFQLLFVSNLPSSNVKDSSRLRTVIAW